MFENHPRPVARVALAGCGCRGASMLPLLLEMEDVRVTAVCDPYLDKAEACAEQVRKAYGEPCAVYTDYREMIEKDDADGVMVSTSWQAHCAVAIAAMRAGKYAAVECGGGCSMDELWDLVRTSEQTGMPCMALENCCYDRNEMAVLNMIKQGIFGEVVHVQGGYGHDLRDEISYGRENRHYRFANYKVRNGELYPGHAIGPMAKYLNVNRGNRMVSLSSMASGAFGLNDYAEKNEKVNPAFKTARFAQGDIVKTNIKCANGELITLTLDTTLPRNYSRNFTVRGTNGYFSEVCNGIHLENVHGEWDHNFYNNVKEYREKYEHPVWHKFEIEGVKGGHGGMDWLVFDAFFEALKNGEVPPIDTYDTAAWMAITPLSEISIMNNGAPQDIPDFTRGMWTHRPDWDKNHGFYALDK